MHPHRYRHDPSKTLVGFTVGDIKYALPIAQVREITNPLAVVALPHAPQAVRGVAEYRGEVIPVVDLRVRFGLAPAAHSRRIKWVVVDLEGRVVALVVDAMLGVFGASSVEIRPAPPLGGGEAERGIYGVASQDKELVFVLDVGAIGDLTAKLSAPASAHRLAEEEA